VGTISIVRPTLGQQVNTDAHVHQLEELQPVVVGDAEQLKLLGVPVYKKQTNEACRAIIA